MDCFREVIESILKRKCEVFYHLCEQRGNCHIQIQADGHGSAPEEEQEHAPDCCLQFTKRGHQAEPQGQIRQSGGLPQA